MTKEEALAQFKAEMEQPCPKCVQGVFKYFMDPLTQQLMHEIGESRDGLLQFHMHPAGPLDDTRVVEGVIMFRMVLRIVGDVWMPYFTPSSPTVEGAFALLRETIVLEAKRLLPRSPAKKSRGKKKARRYVAGGAEEGT